MRSKDKVQEAIMHRLETSTGLNMNSLDITTTSVTFEKNKAYATVAFHPKGDPAVNSGMTMRYTLEARDGQWVVVNVADSQGHGVAGHGTASSDSLPPGHPAIDSPPAGSAAPAAANPQMTPGSQASDGKSQ
ncbi:MAG: hypothetical protein JOY54_00285 [Acidobacteriaceae bacterium]|nr:hypothetical protein [Acidobacteriaceae bacterium]